MKKILFILALTLISITTFGMSYERARENALFLTDKMAYELDLTEEQYEAAYEVNLDYLMGINTPDDVYAEYWRRRNIDLSYILFDWQYTRFCAIDYFYRPLYWLDGYWRFRIYSHYPHRTYIYFGRPACYHSYRGAHAWHIHGRSWYHGHTFHHHEYGMRGGWDRGGYRNINSGWRANDGGHRGIGYRNQGNHRYESGSRYNGRDNHGNRYNDNDNRGNRYNNNDNRGNRNNGRDNHGNNRYESGSRYNGNGTGNNRYESGNRGEGVRRSSTRETVGYRRHENSSSGNSYTPSRDFGSKTISSPDRGSNSYNSSSSNRPSRNIGTSSSRNTSSRGNSFSSGSSSSSRTFSSGSSSRGGHVGGSVSSRGGNSGGGGGGHFGGGHR